MCHPRSESWAKKFPLLTHWSSRGSGSTKQHESVAQRERAATRASTCERAAVRERASAVVNCCRVCTGCTCRKLTTANSCRALSFIYLTEKEDNTHTRTHWHTLAPLHSGRRRLAHGLLHGAQQIFFISYVVVFRMLNVSCGAQRKRIFLNWLFHFLTSFVVYSLYISLYCFSSFQVSLFVI